MSTTRYTRSTPAITHRESTSTDGRRYSRLSGEQRIKIHDLHIRHSAWFNRRVRSVPPFDRNDIEILTSQQRCSPRSYLLGRILRVPRAFINLQSNSLSVRTFNIRIQHWINHEQAPAVEAVFKWFFFCSPFRHFPGRSGPSKII